MSTAQCYNYDTVPYSATRASPKASITILRLELDAQSPSNRNTFIPHLFRVRQLSCDATAANMAEEMLDNVRDAVEGQIVRGITPNIKTHLLESFVPSGALLILLTITIGLLWTATRGILCNYASSLICCTRSPNHSNWKLHRVLTYEKSACRVQLRLSLPGH